MKRWSPCSYREAKITICPIDKIFKKKRCTSTTFRASLSRKRVNAFSSQQQSYIPKYFALHVRDHELPVPSLHVLLSWSKCPNSALSLSSHSEATTTDLATLFSQLSVRCTCTYSCTEAATVHLQRGKSWPSPAETAVIEQSTLFS